MADGKSSSLSLGTDVIAGSIRGRGRGTILIEILESLPVFVGRVVQQIVSTVPVPDTAQSLGETGTRTVELYRNVYPPGDGFDVVLLNLYRA